MMANKGNSRHMKSLASPKYMQVHRKEQRYTAKPKAGRHTLQKSMTLISFAKRVGAAQSGSEATKMIKRRELQVNGRSVKEPNYPLGLNDMVDVVPSKAAYSVGINERGQVDLKELKGQTEDRLCKIVQKYKAKKGALMIRLHDGTVMRTQNKELRVNDSVVVDKKGNVKRVLPLKQGSKCMVIEGVHVGSVGTIKGIKPGSANAVASVAIAQGDGKEFETLLRNIMAVE